ncbi:nucleotidyltransferase domain-containing protein [Tumidithrix elongata RA019]|uniref:Nucleotidyltransferase domain-containing protein n=1 Tax=Tumidithrix elongata BACA0141 TaxID=2716417 RepID=A0AAW9PS15_9CYAN|nr:nucleotidyltransferase domain-containing protein [Tumidithrix elongata RA019]
MISHCQIQAFSEQIAEHFQPEQIILFGSYAYGHPTEDSDVDLLVVLAFEGMSVDKAIEIRRRLKPNFPLDLIARTSKQIQQRLDMGDFFIQDILQKGRILYEANYARVGG